jgi:hypothetical protein
MAAVVASMPRSESPPRRQGLIVTNIDVAARFYHLPLVVQPVVAGGTTTTVAKLPVLVFYCTMTASSSSAYLMSTRSRHSRHLLVALHAYWCFIPDNQKTYQGVPETIDYEEENHWT